MEFVLLDLGDVLFSTDIPSALAEPPSVTLVDPVDRATDVALGAGIDVVFSKAMNRPSVEIALAVAQGATPVDGSFSWNTDSTQVTFSPSRPLLAGTTYELSVGALAHDPYGLELEPAFSSSFTTGGGASSSSKELVSFGFVSPAIAGTIDGDAHTVAVVVPSGTDVTDLVAAFSTTGSLIRVGSVVQTSGVTANDFSSPVDYTVVAGDGSTQDYQVTVTIEDLPLTVESDTILSNARGGISVAVDGADTPHIIGGTASGILHLWRPGVDWLSEPVATATGFSSSELLVDGDGALHVAYTVGLSSSYTLYYATNASGSWVTEVVAGSGNLYADGGIVVNGEGAVHIIYRDAGAFKVRHAVKAPGDPSWSIETVGAAADGSYADASVAVDGGTILVAAADQLYERVELMSATGGAWSYTFPVAGFVVAQASIGMGTGGEPAVAYSTNNLNKEVRFVACSQGVWSDERVAGGDVRGHEDVALMIDPLGSPHVVYADYVSGNMYMRYASRDGDGWIVRTIDETPKVILFVDAAVDAAGRRHVAYVDATNKCVVYASLTGH